jgi:DNA-binding transcriptional LysR family regulator
MEMHQVRYFLAVSRTRNFTRAAEECNVTQPALTRAVKHLEAELGGELFRRERSLTQLTELGRRMLPSLSQCLESALMAKALAKAFKNGEHAPLNVALSRTLPIEILTPHITALTRAFPGIEAKFHRGPAHQILDMLKQGEVELAVAGALGEEWDRLDSWQLFIERFLLAASSANPLAQKDAVELADLAGERVISRLHCQQTAEFLALLRSHGIDKTASHEVSSMNDVIDLVRAGLGIAVLPVTAVCDTVQSIAVEGLDLARPVYLHAVVGRQRSPAACGLIKLLRASDWRARTEALGPSAIAIEAL